MAIPLLQLHEPVFSCCPVGEDVTMMAMWKGTVEGQQALAGSREAATWKDRAHRHV
jgi:hypothetical protein